MITPHHHILSRLTQSLLSIEMHGKSALLFLLAYGVGFVLHIVFAVYNLDLLFKLDAWMVTLMTFLCGPILVWLNRSHAPSLTHARQLSLLGYFMSLPLSVGIAYAYTDMVFEWQASIVAFVLTSIIHGIWFQFLTRVPWLEVNVDEKTH
jgi:hypothetical protein